MSLHVPLITLVISPILFLFAFMPKSLISVVHNLMKILFFVFFYRTFLWHFFDDGHTLYKEN